ncbi:hypothetical protein GW17_00010071 [Ensete ventricosum]|nr:hypothetical protein GW17_00010071 [Ensete ventricosum]
MSVAEEGKERKRQMRGSDEGTRIIISRSQKEAMTGSQKRYRRRRLMRRGSEEEEGIRARFGGVWGGERALFGFSHRGRDRGGGIWGALNEDRVLDRQASNLAVYAATSR